MPTAEIQLDHQCCATLHDHHRGGNKQCLAYKSHDLHVLNPPSTARFCVFQHTKRKKGAPNGVVKNAEEQALFRPMGPPHHSATLPSDPHFPPPPPVLCTAALHARSSQAGSKDQDERPCSSIVDPRGGSSSFSLLILSGGAAAVVLGPI